MKHLLALILLFIASTLFAGTESLVAFGVNRNNDPQIALLSLSGNICELTSSSVGVFDITFCEEESDFYYQIVATEDNRTTDREIRSRSTTGFTLYIKDNGLAADPDGLCIVTISRVDWQEAFNNPIDPTP